MHVTDPSPDSSDYPSAQREHPPACERTYDLADVAYVALISLALVGVLAFSYIAVATGDYATWIGVAVAHSVAALTLAAIVDLLRDIAQTLRRRS